nr:MAG TPA: hypothetical protein [Caudoviricetes sp.]
MTVRLALKFRYFYPINSESNTPTTSLFTPANA